MGEVGLKFSGNYGRSTMTITLVKEDVATGAITMPIEQASKVAGMALDLAAEIHRLSGKPNPEMPADRMVSLTAVQCTGCTIGPARSPKSLNMMFYFGEAVLGIEVPHELAQIFAQRILTASAPQGSAQ